MKSFRAKFLYAVFALFLAVSARATTYTFVDWNLEGLYSYKYLAQNQTYYGTWKISDDPNWSSSLDILSVKTDFWFADDGNDPDTTTKWVSTGYYKTYYKYGKKYTTWVSTGGSYVTTANPANYEEVDIFVGWVQIADNIEVDGTINYHTNLVSYDLWTYDLTSYINIVADISADGILSYTVKAVKGDTYLKETRLTVVAQTRPQLVPDTGSTLVLMGAGLMALVAFRQRR
jgi:hypothetical protein